MYSECKSFIFIHRGKSGGNSISKALLPYCEHNFIDLHKPHMDGENTFDIKEIKYGLRKHAILSEYHKALPERFYNSAYKFTVVRNPFDRLISAYFSRNKMYYREDKSFNKEKFARVIKKQKTLREFVCLKDNDNLLKWVDFFIRFENLGSDFKKVCENLNIPSTVLPWANKSVRGQYRDYYDSELIQLVESRFFEELETFGYQY